MKKIYQIFMTIIVTIAFYACSDSENFDPYKSQTRRPFYPATITFTNISNDNTETNKTWEFVYNADNSIKTYKYTHQTTAANGVKITETHSGELLYYTDATGISWITNKITVNNIVSELTSSESYSETITEDVKLLNGLIQSIKTTGQRNYSNGTKEIYSDIRDFTYSDKYCTNSILKNSSGTTTFQYSWGNGQLKNVTVYEQGNNNNILQQTYNYTYDNRNLSTDYGFNTLAFIYGNFPEVYASMNLFGETSAYKLESETYKGYRNINGTQYNISPINRYYSILETTNNITYTAESPNASKYYFTFSNK